MEKFIIITSREYLNKITNKTFILSTLFTPLILVGVVFLIGWFASINNEEVSNVSVVDNSGYIFDKLESTESIKYTQLENFDLEEAKLISKTKSDFGLLYIENLESPKKIAKTISFYSEDTPSLTVIGNIESQLENILTNKNYKIQGIDINKINSNKIYVSLYQETFQGKKTTKSDSAVGLIFGLLFFPSQNFKTSILVGNLISIDNFSIFIRTNLLFISFLVSLFIPILIIFSYSLRNSLR